MNSDDGLKQIALLDSIAHAVAQRDLAFMEIMNGPNPLTKEEILKLCAKDPIRYNRYKGFAR